MLGRAGGGLADVGGLTVVGRQAAPFLTGELVGALVVDAQVVGAEVVPVVAIFVREAAVGQVLVRALVACAARGLLARCAGGTVFDLEAAVLLLGELVGALVRHALVLGADVVLVVAVLVGLAASGPQVEQAVAVDAVGDLAGDGRDALGVLLAAVRLVLVHALVVDALVDGADLGVVALSLVDAAALDEVMGSALAVLADVLGAQVVVVAVRVDLAASFDVPVETLLGRALVVGAGVAVVAVRIHVAAAHARLIRTFAGVADRHVALELRWRAVVRAVAAAIAQRHPVAPVVSAHVLGAVDLVVALGVLEAAACLTHVGAVLTHVVDARVKSALVGILALLIGLAASAFRELDDAVTAEALVLGARVAVITVLDPLAHLDVLVHAAELLAGILGRRVHVVALGIFGAATLDRHPRRGELLVDAVLVEALVQRAIVEVFALGRSGALAAGY